MKLAEKIIATMTALDQDLQNNYPTSTLTTYVHETLLTLTKTGGVGFTGAYQQFLTQAPIEKLNANLTFTKTETELWERLMSYNQLGNNLWAVFIN